MAQKMFISQNRCRIFDPASVVHQKKRSHPLILHDLSSRFQLVKRGDIVTILAEIKGLTVRVNGNALTDGHRGDEIRVKNQRSKRILQAEVIGPGTVRVRL